MLTLLTFEVGVLPTCPAYVLLTCPTSKVVNPLQPVRPETLPLFLGQGVVGQHFPMEVRIGPITGGISQVERTQSTPGNRQALLLPGQRDVVPQPLRQLPLQALQGAGRLTQIQS